MSRKQTFWIVAALASGVLCGCNVGMQPEGPTVADIKKQEQAMPPQQQIDMIKHSPASPQEKAKMIADVEARTGVKDNGQ